MSIPSITLRLDFGDAGTSGAGNAISVQGDVPSPTGSASNLTNSAQAEAPSPIGFSSDLASFTETPVPTPTLIAATAGTRESVPTPFSAISSNDVAALVSAPEPSVDRMGVGSPGAIDAAPQPEGEPPSVTKKIAKKK